MSGLHKTDKLATNKKTLDCMFFSRVAWAFYEDDISFRRSRSKIKAGEIPGLV
jgi:hypothetical protein